MVAAAAMFIPKSYFPQISWTRTWILKRRMRDLDWAQDRNLNKGYLRWYFILLFDCKVSFFSTFPKTYTKVLMRSQAWPGSVSAFVSIYSSIIYYLFIHRYLVEYLHLASHTPGSSNPFITSEHLLNTWWHYRGTVTRIHAFSSHNTARKITVSQ